MLFRSVHGSGVGFSIIVKTFERLFFRAEHTAMLASVSNLGSVLERQGEVKETEAVHRAL